MNMQKHEHYLQRLLAASPLVYLLVYTVCFAIVLWIFGQFVIDIPLAWWLIALQAVIYGGIMALITWASQRRADAALGDLRPDMQQRLELSHSLRTAKMPEDPALREALPGYLDRIDQQNRRIRLYGPVEFTAFAAVALYLKYQSDNPIWFAFTGLFLGFALLCYLQPTSVLERSASLRKKLERAAKRTGTEPVTTTPNKGKQTTSAVRSKRKTAQRAQ